jgi:hypothetical protein
MTTTKQLSKQMVTAVALVDVMQTMVDDIGAVLAGREAEYDVLAHALVNLLDMEVARKHRELLLA